jgi:hypothetical protein
MIGLATIANLCGVALWIWSMVIVGRRLD